MSKRYYLVVGAALAAVVLLLAAAVPSQTDFDTAYFNTNALPITLTNRLKEIGDLGDAAGYLKNDGAGGFSYDNPAGAGDVVGLNTLTNQMPLLGADSKNVFATNAVGFRAAVGLVIGTDVQAPATTFAGYGISDTSANLRAALTDGSGTGAAIFADGAIGAATVTAPAAADSSTRVPSTAWVQTELADYAPLASPVLSGNPTAPTPSAGDNDTSVATTAFVQTELGDYLPVNNPTATGVVDLGGASVLELPNAAAPTVDAFGEMAADNDLWGAGRGAVLTYDGTAATALIGVLVSDTPSNGEVPTYNTGGTITWEAGGGGATGSNPTASHADNNAINGSAGTFMRSDAVPAISTTGVFQFGRLGLGVSADAVTPFTVLKGIDSATPEKGVVVTNSTAATSGAQKASPALVLQGHGWGTSGSASQPVEFWQYTLPVQGSVPSATWTLAPSINNGALGLGLTYTSAGALTAPVQIVSGGYVTCGAAQGFQATARGSIRFPSDGTFRFENNASSGFSALRLGPDVVTPASPLIRPGDGSGTDKDGGDLSIEGGIGTGTGRGGDLTQKTSLSTTTGSSAQAQTTRGYVSAKFVDLTESTATTVANVAVGASKYVGFTLTCTVNADDGTDFQSLTSQVRVDAINKAGTITATISQTDNTAAASAGTLTCAYTAVANGNSVDIKADAASSITQTTLRAKWVITALNSDDTAVVTPQ